MMNYSAIQKHMEGTSLMSEKTEALTRAERFLMAVSYLEAASAAKDTGQAQLVRDSMTDNDFLEGMTVLNQVIYTLYNQKIGEGETLIVFLRQLGNFMKMEEV